MFPQKAGVPLGVDSQGARCFCDLWREDTPLGSLYRAVVYSESRRKVEQVHETPSHPDPDAPIEQAMQWFRRERTPMDYKRVRR